MVSGRVRAKGPLLKAPCSGSECVAYRYLAYHMATGGSIGNRRLYKRTDYRGQAMTPFQVKGTMKTVAVLGGPDCMEHSVLEDPHVEGSEAKDRLRRYLEKTDFGEDYAVEEKIAPEEAIRAYTLHSAYASFEENLKGSVEAGKFADFSILAADPTTINPNEIAQIPIRGTVINGEVVYNNELC